MKNINEIILEEIIKNIKKIIIMLFWVEFCNPCKIIKNMLNEIKNIFKKKIKILKINISQNIYISEKFSIKNVPTTIIMKNKEIITKKIGIINKEYIKKIIKKYY